MVIYKNSFSKNIHIILLNLVIIFFFNLHDNYIKTNYILIKYSHKNN